MNGIILAGGKSKRLGADKTVVDLGGKRLTEIALDVVRGVTDDVVIVTNSPELFGDLPARLTSDVEPGAGPLGGILSGLLASDQFHNLVVGCDMPFLNPELLRYMQAQAEGYDIVIPRLEVVPGPEVVLEPLHAIYAQTCVEPIRALLARRSYAIVELLGELRVRYVEQDEIDAIDPRHLSFFNVNTPMDLERAREELRKRAGYRE